MARSKDDVLDEYYGLGEYSRRAFDPGSQFTEAEWLMKHGILPEERSKKSTGGRVKLAEGSKKVDPKKALDDHEKALKEMQEALRQVRALAAPGSRLKTIGGKRIGKSKGGRVKLAKGSPNPALMDATSNRATNGKISRGAGSALRGTKFKGVF